MDWYLDPSDVEAPARLRRELGDFFERHSDPESDVDMALLSTWELIANAVRHASGPAWVSLNWDKKNPVIEVHDLGPGFRLEEGLQKEPGPNGGYGLKIVDSTAERLRVEAKRSGGAKVSVDLPLERRFGELRTYVGEPISGAPIAGLADEQGWIGREPFLVAIVANMANAISLDHGPLAAVDMVGRVGGHIGAEMEKAYRQANGIEGPLTAEQMADLFVGLKKAIEGDFYIIEVTEERIVLGNRRCPFGDAVVRRAPALCQMTSAVFGGIAARNRPNATVALNERIAVGDPGCQVVVELSPADQPAS